ncbi:unnamed protein product, partial [Ectocarpus sp. 6 AP-2014]
MGVAVEMLKCTQSPTTAKHNRSSFCPCVEVECIKRTLTTTKRVNLLGSSIAPTVGSWVAKRGRCFPCFCSPLVLIMVFVVACSLNWDENARLCVWWLTRVRKIYYRWSVGGETG